MPCVGVQVLRLTSEERAKLRTGLQKLVKVRRTHVTLIIFFFLLCHHLLLLQHRLICC